MGARAQGATESNRVMTKFEFTCMPPNGGTMLGPCAFPKNAPPRPKVVPWHRVCVGVG